MTTEPGKFRGFVGVVAAAALLAASDGASAHDGASAQSVLTAPAGVVLPPLSRPRAQYFKSHPAAWADFVSRLPRQDAGGLAAPNVEAATSPWATVTAAPVSGLCNPLLLTDGTVIVHNCSTPDWYKLTPDTKGNYADGTWSQIASLPTIGGVAYAPQYHASAVLPDGRVIIMGGEFNGSDTEALTNLGAIYNPTANTWKAVTAPTGWTEIGDAQSVVLASGKFMLASCCSYPDADALLDESTLTWTTTGAPNAGFNYQDEQGYELLPSGHVLTLDIWTNAGAGGNANNAEQYSPITAVWTSAGNTPVSLPDPYACGNFEIGPAVLRGNGTLVAFGGNTGCVAGATADPTAVYHTAAGTWSAGPNVPATCGTGGTTSCTLADAPAALEPNGKILFAASARYAKSPTHFFEFGLNNAIHQVADTVLFAGTSGSYYYNFLVLPNGQILATDFSNQPEVYTPSGAPMTAWAPVISSVPTTLVRGTSYEVAGTGLSGVSQGAYYGDDAQDATNYPIIKVVNTATGDVAYGRSFNFLKMTVSPKAVNTALFVLPTSAKTGPSSLYVVANGIASAPVSVTVE